MRNISYVTQASSPADFSQALAWSDRAIAFVPSFDNLSTNALLLHKLGRKAEALKRREQALDAVPNEKYPSLLDKKALDVILR